MGRGKKRRNRPKRSRDDPGNSPPSKKSRASGWKNTPRENEAFMEFYKKMGVVPEAEWEDFQKTLIEDLPTTFRVSPIGIFNEIAQKYLEEFSIEMAEPELVDGQLLEPPRPIPWYPGKGAWHINAGRGPIRKHPKFKKFHEFLIAFTEFGGISRQEAVSMIPPLLLDVKSDHIILDMCAAPGSKTAQMVEFMHLDAPKDTQPSGVIVANDVDEKRCYMMIHQVNRLSSPCVIATQHLAQKFPYVRMNNAAVDSKHPDLVFDRILADVPCSGDGTLRKNFDLWGKWHAGMGNGLHKIQVQIATRGIKLLKIGGRMVYSTCSLNPVEDEAVVAELLRRGKGSLHLIDVSKELPDLKRANGISKWPICLKKEYFTRYEDITDETSKEHSSRSMFEPTEEEAKEFHLERCLRILPHHQNTGGFFVAVIAKTASIPLHFGETSKEKNSRAFAAKKDAETAARIAAQGDNQSTEKVKEEIAETATPQDLPPTPVVDSALISKSKAKEKGRYSKEDPFMFAKGGRWEGVIQNLKDFYGFNESFPSDLLMVRSEGTCPRIYLICEGAKKILQYEENQCLRVVNMGLRLFGKHSFKEASCPYRINSEGLAPLNPYMGPQRRVDITLDDLLIFFNNEHPLFTRFSETAQKMFQSLEIGGIWLVLNLPEKGLSAPLLLSGWRGKVSSHLLSASSENRILKYLFAPAEVKEETTPKVEPAEVVADTE